MWPHGFDRRRVEKGHEKIAPSPPLQPFSRVVERRKEDHFGGDSILRETRGHRTQGGRLAMNQKNRRARCRSGSHTALHGEETLGRHGQRVDPALNEELREFRTGAFVWARPDGGARPYKRKTSSSL